MKIFTRISIFVVALLLLAACSSNDVHGNGKPVTRTRKVSVFNQIKVSGNYQLNVMVGDAPSVSITTDSNIIPLVVTQVKNGSLIIRNKAGITFHVTAPVRVRVTVPSLKSILSSGANQVSAYRMTGKDFTLKTSGAIQADLSGTVDKLSVLVSGSGTVDADRLVAKTVVVHLNGSGHILVNASSRLDTKIIGSGNIVYSGNPSDVNQTITGAGTIERLR